MSTLDPSARLRTFATHVIDCYADQLDQAREVLARCSDCTLLLFARRMYAIGGEPLPKSIAKAQLIDLLIRGAQILLMRRVEACPVFVTDLPGSEARLERLARVTFEGWMSQFRSWLNIQQPPQFASRCDI